jgi:hypothetical protein
MLIGHHGCNPCYAELPANVSAVELDRLQIGGFRILEMSRAEKAVTAVAQLNGCYDRLLADSCCEDRGRERKNETQTSENVAAGH